MHELKFGGMTSKPQYQLIQKQDQSIIAKTLGVLAQNGQAFIERKKSFAVPACLSVVRGKVFADECTDKLRALFGCRFGRHGRLESCNVPTGFQFPPATSAASAFIER